MNSRTINAFYEKLGNTLRELRVTSGLGGDQIAYELGINEVTYRTYERGERRISVEDLARLATLHKVLLDDLIPVALAGPLAGAHAINTKTITRY